MPIRRATASLAAALLGAWVLGAAPAAAPPLPEPAREAEFARRRAALPAGDQAAALELARWAAGRDLAARAEEVYRSILRDEPDHDEAYPELWALAGGARPRGSEAFDRARRLTTGSFQEHETEHYLILSDADAEWVRGQGQVLEQTYERFLSFSSAFDLRALPPRHKLVALIFNRVDDFRAFVRATTGYAGSTADDLRGFYDVREDRLVLYRVAQRGDVATARTQLEELADEIEHLRRTLRRLRGTARREETRQTQEELDRKSALYQKRLEDLDAFVYEDDLAVVIHEAGHQLMFHTRVQAAEVPQPVWLSEGLAMIFENHDPGSPHRELGHHGRLREYFRQVLDRDEQIPLPELVAMEAMPREPRRWRTLYAQSYVLLSWICRHRRFELHEYIRRLNARRAASAPQPQGAAGTFEAAFGDLGLLERAWLDAVRAGP